MILNFPSAAGTWSPASSRLSQPARHLRSTPPPCVCLLLLLAPLLANPVCGQQAAPYLPPGQPDASAILAPPPLPGSAEQAADMAEVVAVHRGCTPQQAELAFSEKKFSIFSFTPAIGDFFQPGKLPKTGQFFERVLHEAAAATDAGKIYWKRPRPYTVDPSLASGKLEKSFGYPSGHSTEATVLALLLAELFPDRSAAILAVGRDIGWHRVWIARHYPTDIYAGRVFARAVVREFKANPKFRQDFAAVQAELQAAQHPQPEPASAIPGAMLRSIGSHWIKGNGQEGVMVRRGCGGAV